MTVRPYGQYCGVARALELVGERWSLLIVRDLILGPKRYIDLRTSLPRIPASLLSTRLNELEEAGVVRRRVQPELDASVIYELTEYGRDLEQPLLMLGLWGARSLQEPRKGEIFTGDAAVLALYTTFRPEAARNARVSYELRFPDMVVHALVDDGIVKAAEGPYPSADLVIHVEGPFKPLLAGEIVPRAALEHGLVRIAGDQTLLDDFVRFFHIPSAPEPVEGLVLA